jgi:hypothetical protein
MLERAPMGFLGVVAALALTSTSSGATAATVNELLDAMADERDSWCGTNWAMSRRSLLSIGTPAIAPLFEALGSRSAHVASIAADALLDLGQGPAIEERCVKKALAANAHICESVHERLGARDSIIGRWFTPHGTRAGTPVSIDVTSLDPFQAQVCSDMPPKCEPLRGRSDGASVVVDVVQGFSPESTDLYIRGGAPNVLREGTFGEFRRVDLGRSETRLSAKALAAQFEASPRRLRPLVIRDLCAVASEQDLSIMIETLASADDRELPWLAPWFASHPTAGGNEALSNRLGQEYVMKFPVTYALAEAGDEAVVRWAIAFLRTNAKARWIAFQVIARSPLEVAKVTADGIIATESADGISMVNAFLSVPQPRPERFAEAVALARRFVGVRERTESAITRLAHVGYPGAEAAWREVWSGASP